MPVLEDVIAGRIRHGIKDVHPPLPALVTQFRNLSDSVEGAAYRNVSLENFDEPASVCFGFVGRDDVDSLASKRSRCGQGVTLLRIQDQDSFHVLERFRFTASSHWTRRPRLDISAVSL